MHRLVDPIVADMQREHGDAIRHGRVWRSRAILLLSYLGFAKALAFYGVERISRAPLDLERNERRVLGRTLAWGVLLIAVVTAALTAIPLLFVPVRVLSRFRPFYLFALIPQALPLAMPVGSTLAIVVGLGGRAVTRTTKRTILAGAVICSVVSFATLAWVMPQANQAFRIAVFRDAGIAGIPMKGHAEMTLGELKAEIVLANRLDEPRRARTAAMAFHFRWSIPCATLVMVVFAVSLLNPGRARRLRLVAILTATFVGYLLAATGGEELAFRGYLSPVVAVWLPNLLLASYLLLLTSHSSISRRTA
jgi:membrane protease YdiL (CAAX protease family)